MKPLRCRNFSMSLIHRGRAAKEAAIVGLAALLVACGEDEIVGIWRLEVEWPERLLYTWEFTEDGLWWFTAEYLSARSSVYALQYRVFEKGQWQRVDSDTIECLRTQGLEWRELWGSERRKNSEPGFFLLHVRKMLGDCAELDREPWDWGSGGTFCKQNEVP